MRLFTNNFDWTNDLPTPKQIEILGYEPTNKGEASFLIKKLKEEKDK